METKVPFDVEMAKNITDGEIPGKIVTRDGRRARIACWNYKSLSGEYPLLALIENGIFEDQELYTLKGKEKSFIEEACDKDLILKIPEYLTYKEGDIIYCEVDNGGGDYCKWLSIVKEVDCILGQPYVVSYVDFNKDSSYKCGYLEFGCTSDNIGLIRLATDVEKIQFKIQLKLSNEAKAIEYLKRFFEGENSPKDHNSEKIGKKKEKAKEFINKEFDCKACESATVCKFGSGYDSAELYDCNAERYLEIYEEAWDACMKHLASIPIDEAINEIVNSISKEAKL